jgi:hypothetical protein
VRKATPVAETGGLHQANPLCAMQVCLVNHPFGW